MKSVGVRELVENGKSLGRRTRVADLMIAATAHHLGVPLMPRNADDFEASSGHVETVTR
jgi:predicted nucleic acid-binding protein